MHSDSKQAAFPVRDSDGCLSLRLASLSCRADMIETTLQ